MILFFRSKDKIISEKTTQNGWFYKNNPKRLILKKQPEMIDSLVHLYVGKNF